jgi:16S rRNA (uracil1498-N3)-methyltransferase
VQSTRRSRSSSASKTRSASISEPRFFVEGAHETGARVTLGAGDAHKVAHVLRKHVGERIVVIDSAGSVFEAIVDSDDGIFVRLQERADRPSEPAVDVTLAQAVPKGQKMDYVVEKTTELGVAAIVPLHTRRVIGSQTGASKIERWRRIARSAAMQSGRTRVPSIAELTQWDDLLPTFGSYDAVLLPWEGLEPVALRSRLGPLVRGAARILLIIGPEGGFAHDEAQAAIDAGATAIALGPRILRTETAGLIALTAVLYETDNL